MPYERDEDLPESVRENLPKHAQDIYTDDPTGSQWENRLVLVFDGN
ncbi:MAG: hypothetical protein HY678_12540 [Chloroflexi bacterium]|nr:hypothetical protein [Chloroflexota bacterium]